MKKIWDTQYFPYFGWRPESKTSTLVLFKSPTSQIFTSVKPENTTTEWFHQSSEEDLTQIKVVLLKDNIKKKIIQCDLYTGFVKNSKTTECEDFQDTSGNVARHAPTK